MGHAGLRVYSEERHVMSCVRFPSCICGPAVESRTDSPGRHPMHSHKYSDPRRTNQLPFSLFSTCCLGEWAQPSRLLALRSPWSSRHLWAFLPPGMDYGSPNLVAALTFGQMTGCPLGTATLQASSMTYYLGSASDGPSTAMVNGQTTQEVAQLNIESLWAGGPFQYPVCTFIGFSAVRSTLELPTFCFTRTTTEGTKCLLSSKRLRRKCRPSARLSSKVPMGPSIVRLFTYCRVNGWNLRWAADILELNSGITGYGESGSER